MANNMTIGPALEIGGNNVQMTTRGKVQITNPQGQIKTLSKDEFKKQLIKNADKINAGEDFEFRKNNSNLKAAAGLGMLLTAAYTGLSIAVGKGKLSKAIAKEGGKLSFMNKVKNVFVSVGESGVKLFDSLKTLGNKIKKFFTKKKVNEKRYETYSAEQARIDAHRDFAQNGDPRLLTDAERKVAIEDAKAAFKGRNFKEKK